jgi:hypothetical protein
MPSDAAKQIRDNRPQTKNGDLPRMEQATV